MIRLKFKHLLLLILTYLHIRSDGNRFNELNSNNSILERTAYLLIFIKNSVKPFINACGNDQMYKIV